MPNRSKIAVIGASGYSGAEIVSLLLGHPAAELTTLMTTNQERREGKAQKYSDRLPQFYRLCELEIEPVDFDELPKRDITIVFLATPNEISHQLVPKLLERKLRVIDLSGSY